MFFSYSVAYYFTFLMVSFEAQMFLILTKSSVSVFFLLLVLWYHVRESTEKCRSTKIYPCVFFQEF